MLTKHPFDLAISLEIDRAKANFETAIEQGDFIRAEYALHHLKVLEEKALGELEHEHHPTIGI